MLSSLVESSAFQSALLYAGVVLVVAGVALMAAAIYTYRKLDIRAVRDDLSGRARQSEVRQRQDEAANPEAAARAKKGEQPAAKPASERPAPVAPTVPRGQDQVFVPIEEPVRQAPAQPAPERPAPERPAPAPRPAQEAVTVFEPVFDEPTTVLPAPGAEQSQADPARPRSGQKGVSFVVTKCEIAPDRVDVLEPEE